MALSDDFDFQSEPTGPRRFTEYSFGAIMVLISQIISFLALINQITLMLSISLIIPYLFPGGASYVIILIGLNLLVFIVGLFLLFLGYSLHTHGLEENNKIILFNIITIIIEFSVFIIVGIVTGVLGIFVILQVAVVVIVMNFTSIFFLRNEKVQKEFRRARNVG